MTPRSIRFAIPLILCLFVSLGCSQRDSHAAVRAAFPTASIEPVPGHRYEWLVKDSNRLYYVYFLGADVAVLEKQGRIIVPLFQAEAP